ncbi:MAG: type II toxin-antitoxin system HicB family antitoxin [Calditrichaeota bacterium]|nr:type II toxin-antitoxin system HicB family antitoxin [Calditrichota bacterium]
MSSNKYTAVFQQDGEWWVGWIEELPGANTQGKTIEEARENLIEAVQMTIAANREISRRSVRGRKVVTEEMVVAVP